MQLELNNNWKIHKYLKSKQHTFKWAKEEITSKVKKHFEANKNENNILKPKIVQREIYSNKCLHLKKRERSQIKNRTE